MPTMFIPGIFGGQKRALNPLELELEVVVSHIVHVLVIEPVSSISFIALI